MSKKNNKKVKKDKFVMRKKIMAGALAALLFLSTIGSFLAYLFM